MTDMSSSTRRKPSREFSRLHDDDDDSIVVSGSSAPPVAPAHVPALHSSSPEEERLAIIDAGSDSARSKATPLFVFISGFFIVVSTILGSGILALPIKIAKTGFWPFVTGYTITLVGEALSLAYTVEILERAHVIQWRALEEPTSSRVNRVTLSSSGNSLLKRDGNNNGNATAAAGTSASTGGALSLARRTQTNPSILPDLHSVGAMFVRSRWLRLLYQICVILHFVSILISYSLAGSQAYAQILGHVNWFPYIVPLFILIWTALILTAYRIIPHIISLLTLGKGTLLLLLVLLTAYVAWIVDVLPFDNWIFAGRPLLVGTVALGGGMNLLPLIYGRMRAFSRDDMRRLLYASVSALGVVFLLNVLWCYYVLHIVPQTGLAPSLEAAGKAGQIATVPLLQVIRLREPHLQWLALLIDIFVALSISVSFVTVGSGTKHTFDGLAAAVYEKLRGHSAGAVAPPPANTAATAQSPAMGVEPPERADSSWQRWFRSLIVNRLGLSGFRWSLHLVVFASVMLVACTNPHGFVVILERVTSVALNIEAGLFVGLMLELSRRASAGIPVPYVLPRWVFALRWPMIWFFMFASVYSFVDLFAQEALPARYSE